MEGSLAENVRNAKLLLLKLVGTIFLSTDAVFSYTSGIFSKSSYTL